MLKIILNWIRGEAADRPEEKAKMPTIPNLGAALLWEPRKSHVPRRRLLRHWADETLLYRTRLCRRLVLRSCPGY